ncbi:MAG: glycosyltransferase [Candidatus Eisenbacteria bacterium]|uniref:Glycosyltransferase n=1 Tax=Eiseniibacteriota bacterium TaxID=2212470 RepID=A0A849SL87_UNCEI|nr:glycosyltransferase [Candidatus Eisenbacteria bacterium]
MKIATLSNASVGHTRRWVEHFRARGHEVRLWSLEPGPSELGAIELPNAPVPGALRYPLAAPGLARALAEFAPAVVDAHYVPNYGLLGALTGRRPLVVSAWGSDLLISGSADVLRRARSRWVLRRADLVITDARNLAAAAVRLGAPAERVACVPWGVDLTRFRPRGERERGLVLSTRMHEPIYDIERILLAFDRLLARHPQARLVVAGDGSMRPELERLAARCLPAGRYEFIGLLTPDVMSEWLARAEVMVSASRSDSTSISLLEAMASGAVPVVSDIEGNREWIDDGVEGRLFGPGLESLVAALDVALTDATWRERAQARARKRVVAHGDLTRNMATIEAHFERLAASRGGRGAGAPSSGARA